MPDSDAHPAGTIPDALHALVDDAAMFPPGSASLADAVRWHRQHRASSYAPLVGPLVVPHEALAELAALLAGDGEPLTVSVVLPGPDSLEAVVRLVADAPTLRLRGLEVTPDPAQPRAEQVDVVAARREALADTGVLDPDALLHVEVPRPGEDDADAVLDAVARHGLRPKLRTGGGSADRFPADDELARWLLAVIERGLAFKCTAGLHRAVRHRDPATGFEHHGYLNVLLATARAAAGAGASAVAGVLAERDQDAVAEAVRTAGHADLADARRRFTSYGSCSVLEPLGHLEQLGLLGAPAGAG